MHFPNINNGDLHSAQSTGREERQHHCKEGSPVVLTVGLRAPGVHARSV